MTTNYPITFTITPEIFNKMKVGQDCITRDVFLRALGPATYLDFLGDDPDLSLEVTIYEDNIAKLTYTTKPFSNEPPATVSIKVRDEKIVEFETTGVNDDYKDRFKGCVLALASFVLKHPKEWDGDRDAKIACGEMLEKTLHSLFSPSAVRTESEEYNKAPSERGILAIQLMTGRECISSCQRFGLTYIPFSPDIGHYPLVLHILVDGLPRFVGGLNLPEGCFKVLSDNQSNNWMNCYIACRDVEAVKKMVVELKKYGEEKWPERCEIIYNDQSYVGNEKIVQSIVNDYLVTNYEEGISLPDTVANEAAQILANPERIATTPIFSSRKVGSTWGEQIEESQKTKTCEWLDI